MVFLAGEQDMYYGMCKLEFSSALMHVEINSLLCIFYMCHMFLHAFVYHAGSGFTQLLLIIWQRARWLFLKDANLETIWGGGAVLHTIFPSKKNQYYRQCFILSM